MNSPIERNWAEKEKKEVTGTVWENEEGESRGRDPPFLTPWFTKPSGTGTKIFLTNLRAVGAVKTRSRGGSFCGMIGEKEGGARSKT